MYHERDIGSLGINYRIVFENVTRLEKNNWEVKNEYRKRKMAFKIYMR
jgi:hypothetical protein